MDLNSGATTIIAIVVLAVIAISLLAFVASRVRRVPPNEALIVVGRGAERTETGGIASPQKVIIGGRTFVWPVFQEGFKLSLEQYQTPVEVEAIDSNFIRTGVKATVNFKVTGTEDGVRRAAQRYLLQQHQLTSIVQQSLEGSLRGLIGGQAVDDLVKNFSRLAADAVNETKQELSELGLQIETLNVRDVSTPGSTYLQDRGRAEAATARQQAEVKEAEAERSSALARIENEQQTNERQLELDLRKSQIKAETDRAAATATAAGELARAEQDALVAAQERAATAAQAEVTEQRLIIDVRKPAEAAAYAAVQEANAQRDTLNARVEADVFRRTKEAEAARTAAENQAAADVAAGEAAASVQLARGEAEARIVAAKGTADAEVIAKRGTAEASSIKEKGLAEAEAVSKLAEARNKLDGQGLAALVAGQLPGISAEIAKGYGQIESLSIISTDGASATTKDIAGGMAGTFDIVKQTTGLDLAAIVGGRAILDGVGGVATTASASGGAAESSSGV